MSLPNEGFPSFPACPSTPSPSFTHNVAGGEGESGRERKKTRSTLGTAEYGGSGTLSAEVSGSWHRLQGNKDCVGEMVWEDGNLYSGETHK